MRRLTIKELQEEIVRIQKVVTTFRDSNDEKIKKIEELETEIDNVKVANDRAKQMTNNQTKELQFLSKVIIGEAEPSAKIEVLKDIIGVPRNTEPFNYNPNRWGGDCF